MLLVANMWNNNKKQHIHYEDLLNLSERIKNQCDVCLKMYFNDLDNFLFKIRDFYALLKFCTKDPVEIIKIQLCLSLFLAFSRTCVHCWHLSFFLTNDLECKLRILCCHWINQA